MRNECLLHRVKPITPRHTFDRKDVRAVLDAEREREASN